MVKPQTDTLSVTLLDFLHRVVYIECGRVFSTVTQCVAYIECDSGGCLQIRLVMKADCQRHFQCDGQLLSADKRQKDKNTKDRSMSHESCLADMKTGSSEKNLKIVEWVKHVQAPIIWAFSPPSV